MENIFEHVGLINLISNLSISVVVVSHDWVIWSLNMEVQEVFVGEKWFVAKFVNISIGFGHSFSLHLLSTDSDKLGMRILFFNLSHQLGSS